MQQEGTHAAVPGGTNTGKGCLHPIASLVQSPLPFLNGRTTARSARAAVTAWPQSHQAGELTPGTFSHAGRAKEEHGANVGGTACPAGAPLASMAPNIWARLCCQPCAQEGRDRAIWPWPRLSPISEFWSWWQAALRGQSQPQPESVTGSRHRWALSLHSPSWGKIGHFFP